MADHTPLVGVNNCVRSHLDGASLASPMPSVGPPKHGEEGGCMDRKVTPPHHLLQLFLRRSQQHCKRR